MNAALRRRRWLAFTGLAAIVVVADQLSKLWIDANFTAASVHPLPGVAEPTPIIGDLLRIAKSYNSGGIFGLAGDTATALALASTVVIALIVIYQAREGMRSHWLLTVALGLLMGGALGNFADRARLGRVIDFVDMGVGDLRWYTFNVADAAISTSIVLFIGIGLLGDRLTRRHSAPGTEVAGRAAAEAPR